MRSYFAQWSLSKSEENYEKKNKTNQKAFLFKFLQLGQLVEHIPEFQIVSRVQKKLTHDLRQTVLL